KGDGDVMQEQQDTARGIVIVGAGQAGARAAEAARSAGYAGRITLIGAEAHLPYERPQLSKEMLLDVEAPLQMVRDAEGWAALNIDVVTGARIVSGDIRKSVVVAEDGRLFFYDKLLIATGTAARRLPALEAGPLPVLTLRTIEDALALRAHLRPGLRLAVVGGGVIGLEAAAAATKMGATVTVIEAAATLLSRALPPVVSDFLRARHEQAGVVFRLGQPPISATAEGVVLASGEVVPADLILVGIGVEPELDLARSLGLEIDSGIKVDGHGRTSVHNVFAAGDVVSQWCAWHGRAMRIETWANAQNQAAAAARSMVGELTAYQDAPWFWTNQYELNIQVVGNAVGGEVVVRGTPAGGRFSVANLVAGEVVGAVTVNMPKDMASLRRLVAARRSLAADELKDPGFDLRRAAAVR
ncbi:MAG: FAD-dependent oxidoreductase, partial [Zavarzinia sp.]|nr:FAD-dependent oxidoreductase [Zavarzinia sp.]